MESKGGEEQLSVEATRPQKNFSVKTIAGVIVVLIMLVFIVAFTPFRGILESWWSDYRDQQKLNNLERFEQEQPQGDLTTEDKFNAIR